MRFFNLKLLHYCLFTSAHRQDVFLHIFANHVERQASRLKNPKTVPLALGKEPDTIVFADGVALGVHDRAGLRRKPFSQKFRNRNRPDEANPLAIGAGSFREIEVLGGFPHFFFGVTSDWKHNLFKLFLDQLVEEIALVLTLVYSAEQVAAVLVPLDPSVMAGGDEVYLEIPQGFFHKNPELDLAVADDVRIGGSAGFILVEEASYNLGAALAVQIPDQDRNFQVGRYPHRHLAVLGRGAVGPIVVAEEMHPDDLIALFFQQRRGDGGVHPSRNAYGNSDRFIFKSVHLFIGSGHRPNFNRTKKDS